MDTIPAERRYGHGAAFSGPRMSAATPRRHVSVMQQRCDDSCGRKTMIRSEHPAALRTAIFAGCCLALARCSGTISDDL
jgi:hypothetical protein